MLIVLVQKAPGWFSLGTTRKRTGAEQTEREREREAEDHPVPGIAPNGDIYSRKLKHEFNEKVTAKT